MNTGSVSNIGTTQNGSYTDTGLSANTTCYYKVSIVTPLGEGRLSKYVSAATRIPAFPLHLKVMALSSDSILLSWDAVPMANSYHVYRAENSSGQYNAISAATTRTSHIDTGLSADTTYYYKVTAMNGLVEGDMSELSLTSTLSNGERLDVGDTGPAGGILFYVDDTGFISGGVTYYYLEAAPADLGTYRWGGAENSYSSYFCGTETAIGTGAANTAALTVLDHGHEHPAARACKEYSYGGYDDWFLPSKDELNLMYTNLKRQGLGGFSDSWYWSSSELYSYSAWPQYFAAGSQHGSSKGNEHSVRAVRMF
ncbi:MAG: DUF1566 domain-containing protein [Treponema sp.]|nr:DUF1566 domain-containing protein [Treponema sp.]